VRKEVLASQIARGEYTVDPHAVAEAMLRNDEFRTLRVRPSRPLRASAVFVAAEALDLPAHLVEQDEPDAGGDLP
jgi:hypothetical protein